MTSIEEHLMQPTSIGVITPHFKIIKKVPHRGRFSENRVLKVNFRPVFWRIAGHRTFALPDSTLPA
jgi:hypothetical protein